MVNFYSARTNRQDTIESLILKKSPQIELDTLSWHKDEITIGDIVYIIVSGDKAKKNFSYENGLRAIGKVIQLPYDWDGKHFKIKVSVDVLLNKSLTKDVFYPYPDLINCPSIGPETSNAPNQAFRKLEKLQGESVLKAMADINPEIKDSIFKLSHIDNYEILKLQLLNDEIAKKVMIRQEDFNIGNFISDLNNLNIKYDSNLILRFISSIYTKPFTLLTGLSGSGKTLLAQVFAKWLQPLDKTIGTALNKIIGNSDFQARYEITIKTENYLEVINKNGPSQKRIPAPIDLLKEWCKAFQDGIINEQTDVKEARDLVGNFSKYQKYIHGFYNDYFSIAHLIYLELSNGDAADFTIIETSVKYTEKSIENSFGWTLKQEVVEDLIGEKDIAIQAKIGGVEASDCRLRYFNQFYFDRTKEKETISKAIKENYTVGDEIPLTLKIPNTSKPEQCYELIPVGANWTSKEDILGYPDALNKGRYVKTPTMELLLRAEKDPTNPYWLILDEMNLSHVERYFADFLSAMESGEPIPIHDDKEKEMDGVPHEIKVPPNFFIIGTVNVDETTYMFSPKVLDRANVIEFRAEPGQITEFLKNPSEVDLDSISGEGAPFALAFVETAKQKMGEDFKLEDKLEPGQLEALKKELELLFAILAKHEAEFGFRTAKEISRFVYFHKLLTNDNVNWKLEDALDAQIMQKILPKMHGSQSKLAPVLQALGVLCFRKDEWKDNLEAVAQQASELSDDTLDIIGKDNEDNPLFDPENAYYPISFRKIQRMLKKLERDGFASFAEA